MLQILLLHVECKKFCKLITFTKQKKTKRPNKYIASFKIICSQAVTENFWNSSIWAIQLIKKGTFS